MSDSLVKKRGIVTSFDPVCGQGLVSIDGHDIPFDETQFRIGRPIRAPHVGDDVDAVFHDGGGLLSLRTW